MWSFGYDDPFAGDSTQSVYLGSASTFPAAVDELLSNVEKMASDAEKYEESIYEEIISSIRTIADDPAYREDPDQWEDMDFFDESGNINLWVVED